MTLQGKYADQETFMRRYGFDGDATYKSFINLEKLSTRFNFQYRNI